PEPLVDRAFRRVVSAEAEAGGGSLLRPFQRRSFSPWHHHPALAPRQGPASMHAGPAEAKGGRSDEAAGVNARAPDATQRAASSRRGALQSVGTRATSARSRSPP